MPPSYTPWILKPKSFDFLIILCLQIMKIMFLIIQRLCIWLLNQAIYLPVPIYCAFCKNCSLIIFYKTFGNSCFARCWSNKRKSIWWDFMKILDDIMSRYWIEWMFFRCIQETGFAWMVVLHFTAEMYSKKLKNMRWGSSCWYLLGIEEKVRKIYVW